jgi:hypothetical protein
VVAPYCGIRQDRRYDVNLLELLGAAAILA